MRYPAGRFLLGWDSWSPSWAGRLTCLEFISQVGSACSYSRCPELGCYHRSYSNSLKQPWSPRHLTRPSLLFWLALLVHFSKAHWLALNSNYLQVNTLRGWRCDDLVYATQTADVVGVLASSSLLCPSLINHAQQFLFLFHWVHQLIRLGVSAYYLIRHVSRVIILELHISLALLPLAFLLHDLLYDILASLLISKGN